KVPTNTGRWVVGDSATTPLTGNDSDLLKFVDQDSTETPSHVSPLSTPEILRNVDLLRLFISPTGRMLPRRFTGLRAKQQRQLAAAIKNARQMALLPYTSRYPMPSPEQMQLLTEQAVAMYDDFDFESGDHERDEDDVDAMYVEE
ncbi:hypothetical protein DYB36_006016, partial [Aphanomyces astaci]